MKLIFQLNNYSFVALVIKNHLEWFDTQDLYSAITPHIYGQSKNVSVSSTDGLIPRIPDKRFFCNAPWSRAISSPFDVMNGGTLVQPEHWTEAQDPDK